MAVRRRRSSKAAHKKPATAKKRGVSAAGASIEVTIGNVPPGALAKVFGVDVRSLANFVDEGMPKDARGEFPLAACVQWYIERERTTARASKGLNDLDRARLRKIEAEAIKAEREAQLLELQVIRVTEHEEVVGALCDRLRPTVINIPSTYGMLLEELGISATDAESVLERIAEELMTAMRGTSDELDELGDEAEAEQRAQDQEQIELQSSDAENDAREDQSRAG